MDEGRSIMEGLHQTQTRITHATGTLTYVVDGVAVVAVRLFRSTSVTTARSGDPVTVLLAMDETLRDQRSIRTIFLVLDRLPVLLNALQRAQTRQLVLLRSFHSLPRGPKLTD